MKGLIDFIVIKKLWFPKNRVYIKGLLFVGIIILIAILTKANTVRDIYLANPLSILGVVTSGITGLITMLIFIINFNINDIYLGKSKSKVYLEDRVLIRFFKSKVFKLIFLIFLVITLKLCGIKFKSTYIYEKLESIKILIALLKFIENYYIDVGVFSFLTLSLTILSAIMGNIDQLFHTINFKENEMDYLKRKIERSIANKYRNLLKYKEYRNYFFHILTIDYKKIKEEEEEKFLQIVFKESFCNNFINYNIKVYDVFKDIYDLFEFLDNKYKWIESNISSKNSLEKILLEDIIFLSKIDKEKFNYLKIEYFNLYFNDFLENNDIRIYLIEKFIRLENQDDWKFICNLVKKISNDNNLVKDTLFIKWIFNKIIRNIVDLDYLEEKEICEMLKRVIYNIELEKLKNEVFIKYLYDQNTKYLEKYKYKYILELLSEEYKISWAFYKIFEEKYKWTEDVEFAFEVLYKTNLNRIKIDYHNTREIDTIEKLKKILDILNKSRLHYRMKSKYEYIFDNLKKDINYEFEKALNNIDINIFKFILIRDWIYNYYGIYNNYYIYTDKLEYFNEMENDIYLISNLFEKILLYVEYKIIKRNKYIHTLLFELVVKYRDLIIKNIFQICNWKILMYLETRLGDIIKIYFNNKISTYNLSLVYFHVLLNKEEYRELYSDENFKKELYNTLSEYMKTSNKTLKETIDEFNEYRELSELEKFVLRRELYFKLIE